MSPSTNLPDPSTSPLVAPKSTAGEAAPLPLAKPGGGGGMVDADILPAR